MIKTENGTVAVSGTRHELFADLGVIIKSLVTEGVVSRNEARVLVDIAPMTEAEADAYMSGLLRETEVSWKIKANGWPVA